MRGCLSERRKCYVTFESTNSERRQLVEVDTVGKTETQEEEGKLSIAKNTRINTTLFSGPTQTRREKVPERGWHKHSYLVEKFLNLSFQNNFLLKYPD